MEPWLVSSAIFLTLLVPGSGGRGHAHENTSTCGTSNDSAPSLGWLRELSQTLNESVAGKGFTRAPSQVGESLLDEPGPGPSPSPEPSSEPSPESVPSPTTKPIESPDFGSGDDDGEKPSDRYDLTDDPPKRTLSRLKKSAQAAAAACRTRKGRTICGVTRSKYLCYRGVKEALAGAGLVPAWWPEDAAIDAHRLGTLKKKGFRNVMDAGKAWNEWNAPIGSVLVYAGGQYNCRDERKRPLQCGHIEIKLSATKYCSDYCKSIPVSVNLDRKLVGIYVKE